MKLLQEGDKSKAICNQCRAMVATTFVRRDVPFSDGKGQATNVLAGVCDRCGAVISIPAQSTPAIREARQKVSRSLEAQLPAIYLDALDLSAHAIDSSASTDFRKVLLTYYVHRYGTGRRSTANLLAAHRKARAEFKESRGMARRRLSMKVSSSIAETLRRMVDASEMSTTEVIKSVVYEIQSDILDAPRPALMRELRALAVISG